MGLHVVVACALLVSAPAQAALPASLAVRIQEAAAQSRHLVEQEAAFASTLDDRNLSAAFTSKASRRAELALNSVVIGAIAQHPALAADIVAAAISAAPALRGSILRGVGEAFPGLAVTARHAGGALVLAESPPLAAPDRPAPEPTFEPTGGPGREVISDPLEGINRVIFIFNDGVDTFVLRPVAALYGFILPATVKRGVGNGFENLNAPVVLANDLLQLELGDAATTTGRFVVNSTVGVLGLFDVAEAFGLPHHPADFGQTLYTYEVGPGPYLVLPLLGPSTTRDGLGKAVDIFLDPLTYVLDTGSNLARGATKAVVRREQLLAPLEDLRATSIDYYAALRSAYYQDRRVVLRKGSLAPAPDLDAMFDAVEIGDEEGRRALASATSVEAGTG